MDPNSVMLYKQEYEKARLFMEHWHVKPQRALADFRHVLSLLVAKLDSQNPVKESPMANLINEQYGEYLVKRPSGVKNLLKDHKQLEAEIVVRRRRNHSQSHDSRLRRSVKSVNERRVTVQPRLSISTKPVQHPLNYLDTGSLRENLLYESFQAYIYYLSNLLLTALPMLKQAIKLAFIRKGIFESSENPQRALRYCGGVRNINLGTFLELRTLAMKIISRDFRTPAEKKFDSALEECGTSDYLEAAECSVEQ